MKNSADASVAWILWFVLCAASVGFVLRFGFPLPYADEMELVPYAFGESAVTLKWLWSPHNEHRLLLPRLLYLGLLRLTSGELRYAALYNTAVLAAASAWLMLVARRVRGRTRWWDAFFPAVLLHWSHAINLLWIFQSAFATAVALTCVLLGLVVTAGPRLSVKRGIGVSICLTLLALCGANGVVQVPGMCGWLCYAAAGRWRDARGSAIALLLLAAVPAVLLGLYFVDFERPTLNETAAPSWLAKAATSLEMLAASLGAIARETWPVSGVLALAVVGACGLGLVRSWRDRPDERLATFGLTGLLCGQLALAVGIGWGRAALGSEAGLTGRYLLLGAPLACLAYLLALSRADSLTDAFAKTATGKQRLVVVLAALLCVTWVINMRKGLRDAQDLDAKFSALTADIRQGLMPVGLACRHCFLYPLEHVLAIRLESLRRAQFGAFAATTAEGKLRSASVLTLAIPPADASQLGEIKFALSPGQELCRVDLPISRPRRGESWPALHWALVRREGTASACQRQGQVDLALASYHRFVRLQFEPVAGGGEFEVTFHAATPEAALHGAPGGLLPPLAGLRPAPGLKAFLFVQPASHLAQPAETMRR